MALEEKCDAHQMVMNAGMSARPEFYSGRGALSDDLTGKKLERIYEQIEHVHGERAAQSFAQMVADIPVLSATDFLLSLYQLEARDWEWHKQFLGEENGVDVGPDYGNGTREAIGMATIIFTLGGLRRDDTGAIRNSFLQRHGINIPQKPYKSATF